MSGAAVNRLVGEAGPSRHVPEELLVDYASGASSVAVAMTVAAHLSYCPVCRAELSRLEALGGAMFESAEDSPLPESALTSVLARLDTPVPPPPPLPAFVSGLPRPICQYVGQPLERLPWRTRLPGFAEYRLPVPSGQGKVSLLRIRPGRSMPQHTHEGNELVLVLRGSYTDALGHFGPGDVAVADADVDHRPVADMGQDCVCLAVTDAPLRLTGSVGRMFARFVRF
ncbi:MAG TPA: ChrR family anti-sigma-E factor [Stellaceae bacterium]|nr:ChrR family anti-sigma-E factor [Stellaceae bacterium]